MSKTRIRVDIMGRGLNLISEENPRYLVKVAKEVDLRMRKMKNENPKLTYDTAAVLTALNLCDELLTLQNNDETENELLEAEAESNRIRKQVVEYSRELSKAVNTIKRLEKELKESHINEEKLRRDFEIKEKEFLDMLG